MKKTYLIIAVFLLMSVIAGCMSTETDKDMEEETTISVEAVIDTLDWDKQQINEELNKNFILDAVITPESVYDKGIGLYKYGEFSEEDYNREEIVQSLTAYNEKYAMEGYTPEILMSVDSLNMSAILNSEYAGQYEGISDCIDTFFPIENQEGQYDKEKAESVINEFVQAVSGGIDLSSYGYRCFCWNQELRDKINQFTSDMDINPVVDIESLQENFYHIRIMKEPNEGCFIKDLAYASRPVLSGEQPGNLTEIDVNGNMEPRHCGNYVDIYLDENYSVIAYSFQIISKIEDIPFDTIDIIPAKDIIKSVYNKFKNSYKSVAVKDIRLVYSRYLDENLGEDNTREPYIAPYWVVTYFIEGNESSYQMFYSAIDGAIIYSIL